MSDQSICIFGCNSAINNMAIFGLSYHFISVLDMLIYYFDNLAADCAICTAFGTTFTKGTNLFVGTIPAVDNDLIGITTYGGSPPTKEGDRLNPYIQILTKTKSRERALLTMQSIINDLHMNTNAISKGVLISNNSDPILLGFVESGEYCLAVSNYQIKHVKN